MTKIIVQRTKQQDAFTLKAVADGERHIARPVERKKDKITFIPGRKTYYLYLDKKSKDYNFEKIYNFFVNFAQENEKDLNIMISSFISADSKLNYSRKVVQAVSEGILFGTHKAISYKSKDSSCKKDDKSEVCYYLVIAPGTISASIESLTELLDKSKIKLQAVNFARDLQDDAPNKLYAQEFVKRVKSKFKDQDKKIQIEVLDKKAIEKNKMNLLLAVNSASHHEPRVIILRYKGNSESKETLGLIGKGITFDSGGYNLKPSSSLQCMKFDMSGAAVVCASFLALSEINPKINVVAIACLTDNRIGGHAVLTESVVTSMSRKTVEINNTDAEGRLVLADGITYAIEKERVTKIITVATLTGACVLALGENTTGVMTNNPAFHKQICQAAKWSREKIWELPLLPENTNSLKENTTIADISNVASSRNMGASNGAAFLEYFVNNLPFIHCDIAGTAWKTKTKRGTGVMVKTLIEMFTIVTI